MQVTVFLSLSSVEHSTEALPTGASAAADGFAFLLPSEGLNPYKMPLFVDRQKSVCKLLLLYYDDLQYIAYSFFFCVYVSILFQ